MRTPSNEHAEQALRLAQSPPYPSIGVDEVVRWKKGKKRDNLPGLSDVRNELRGRGHVFVIDDSRTMRDHRHAVMATAKALMYLVKDVKAGGIELRFASAPKKRHKATGLFSTRTTKLVKKIGSQFDNCDAEACNMEQKLDSVVKAVVRKGRLTNIIVFTDGVWQPGATAQGGGVENTIKSVVENMKRQGMPRTDVTFQFVRFGDDKIGKARLTYLDNKLKSEQGMDD
jgi:hypothetical protein